MAVTFRAVALLIVLVIVFSIHYLHYNAGEPALVVLRATVLTFLAMLVVAAGAALPVLAFSWSRRFSNYATGVTAAALFLTGVLVAGVAF